MSNVVDLPVITTLDLDPAKILEAACKVDFQRVIVIGYTSDNEEYLAISDADFAHAVFDMERAKLKMLREFDPE